MKNPLKKPFEKAYGTFVNKRVGLLIILILFEVSMAQGADELGSMTQTLSSRLTSLFKLMSVLVIAGCFFGIPALISSLNTSSTTINF
jgi:hypothetical protein